MQSIQRLWERERKKKNIPNQQTLCIYSNIFGILLHILIVPHKSCSNIKLKQRPHFLVFICSSSAICWQSYSVLLAGLLSPSRKCLFLFFKVYSIPSFTLNSQCCFMLIGKLESRRFLHMCILHLGTKPPVSEKSDRNEGQEWSPGEYQHFTERGRERGAMKGNNTFLGGNSHEPQLGYRG